MSATETKLTEAEKSLLLTINKPWPESVTIHPETDALFSLREKDYIMQWDSWPDGRRRWVATHAGRAALGDSHE